MVVHGRIGPLFADRLERGAAGFFLGDVAVHALGGPGDARRDVGPARGADAVDWDGRGADGVRLASGIYLARLTEDSRAGTARILIAR